MRHIGAIGCEGPGGSRLREKRLEVGDARFVPMPARKNVFIIVAGSGGPCAARAAAGLSVIPVAVRLGDQPDADVLVAGNPLSPPSLGPVREGRTNATQGIFRCGGME